MDFDSHLTSMQPSLCNVVTCGEVPVGSMMALMTEQEQENGDQLMGTAGVHGPFTYYSRSTEPYLQAAFFQPTQALHIHHVEPHTSEIHFSMDQLDAHDVVLAEDSTNQVKSEHGLQKEGHFSSRRECYSEPPLFVSQTGSVTYETRVSSTSLDMESTCRKQVSDADSIRAKIIAHPQYPRLVLAYMNCHKVGAPPEVVTRLDELTKDYQNFPPMRSSDSIGADPELDQFMDTYCDTLQKYHDELTRPFKEAMAFFRKIELQLNSLSKGSLRSSQSVDEKMDANGSSDDDDGSCGELDYHEIDPLAEDNKLKEQLLRKYSGYICSLKQEFLKKKKKGKLPKDARQKLLDWWSQHYKWPYPSETEKAALADSTGLDQKQINNWFINQRKRHWKPSEDMQYVVVDSPGSHAAMAFVEATSIKPEAGTLPMNH